MVNFINPKELFEMLKKHGKDTDLIDIRSNSEYIKCHIPMSKPLNISSISFIEYEPKKKLGVFYCSTSKRTMEYIDDIKEISYEAHFILLGGINSWKKLLFPVCCSDHCKCAAFSFQ